MSLKISVRAIAGAAVAAAAVSVAGFQATPPAAAKLVLAPCDIEGLQTKARCGTYQVWENRDAKAGRRIPLKVVVVPATGEREADAFTYFAGGPGEAATRLAPFLATEFAAFRVHHDLLLVDQRGTGGSHALDCDLYPGTDAQAALGAFYPPDRVRACRTVLEKDADLRFYTTPIAVDDLDEVREALGYARLNLFGGSYGTRAALVYIRRHEDHVRSAVLQGVQPATDAIPLRFPKFAQQAIDAIFADCAADAACHTAFPSLPAELRAIVDRASKAPVPVDILDPKTGDPIHVSLTRDLLGEALRYLMYQSATGLLVPSLVHQASEGDFGALAEFALFSRRQLVNGLGQGLYLSVTCSEDLPFIEAAEAEREASNTFLGDYRYRQQRAACEQWVRGPIPADYRQPTKSNVPVLMLSGAWDPVTPPSNAQAGAATLPRAALITVPSGGHDYDGLEGVECVGELVGRFLNNGSADGLDKSCVNRIRRPPFPTTAMPTRPVTLTPDQLAAFNGRYVTAGAPDLQIRATNGKLSAKLGDEDAMVLVPVTPTRLRVLGAVGSYLDVEMENGRPSRMTLDRTGVKSLTWKREQ
ncbi:MAG: alpha/beta hydrolase [Bacteroidales bacterium]